jgi:uncharacterized protein
MLLLPPSEGKALDALTGATPSSRAASGWDAADGAFGQLADRRRAVVAALGAIGGGDAKLLGVRGDHLSRAQSANVSLPGAPTMPAWQRYTGVVWDHLDPATLPAAARRRIVVVSGLLGLVRADDPVPDYRLKMGANLAPLGKLSTWWRADLSAALNRAARRRMVIDLLPQEHRAAWVPEGVSGVSVSLVDPTGAPGGHFAKAAKGELARALLTDGIGALETWRHDRFELLVTPLAPPAPAPPAPRDRPDRPDRPAR